MKQWFIKLHRGRRLIHGFYYLGDDEYKAHYSILLAHNFQRELNNQLASLISYDASRGYADQDR